MKTIETNVVIPTIFEDIKMSAAYKCAMKIISDNRIQRERKDKLLDAGFNVMNEVACGPGGVGSIKIRRSGFVYLQCTCGHGRHNYADCVELGHIRKSNGISRDYFLGAI